MCKAPCAGCLERKPACHDICPMYTAWAILQKAEKNHISAATRKRVYIVDTGRATPVRKFSAAGRKIN